MKMSKILAVGIIAVLMMVGIVLASCRDRCSEYGDCNQWYNIKCDDSKCEAWTNSYKKCDCP